MMNTAEKLFISLLRKSIDPSFEVSIGDDADFGQLCAVAKGHDLCHLLYKTTDNGAMITNEEAREYVKQQYSAALLRHVKKEIAIEDVRSVLNANGIDFILLKGTALMHLYPEEWMRTSSDIDVLVREKDFERAESAFSDLGMQRTVQSGHDVSFRSRSRYHVELHHTLIEYYRFPKTVEVLKKVWDHAHPSPRGGFEYELSDEMLYYYHIAHMVKHFETGGCGVRTFIDLWLLDHRTDHDRSKREALLRSGGILTFAKKAAGLADTWFSGADEDPELEDVERFVLNGGVFGTHEQKISVQKKKTNNRFKYYVQRVFLPYRLLYPAYPVLKKAPVLLPFIWIVRWFKLLDPKKRKEAMHEIDIERNTDEEAGNRIYNMMKDLEIW